MKESQIWNMVRVIKLKIIKEQKLQDSFTFTEDQQRYYIFKSKPVGS